MQWSIHPVFHTDLLIPYQEMEMQRENYTWPMPKLINGEEEYKIEQIINSEQFGRSKKLQYLVSSGKGTLTQTTNGLIRMMSLLMKQYGSLNSTIQARKCIISWPPLAKSSPIPSSTIQHAHTTLLMSSPFAHYVINAVVSTKPTIITNLEADIEIITLEEDIINAATKENLLFVLKHFPIQKPPQTSPDFLHEQTTYSGVQNCSNVW